MAHMSKAAILEACEKAGGQTAFARLLGLKSQGSVSNYIKRGRLPPKYVLTVEARTGVSRHKLRPDIYPKESTDRHGATI